MKSIYLLFILSIISLLFLAGCNEAGVYEHLQGQEIGVLHDVDLKNETENSGNASQESLYEHLNDNLQSRLCLGDYTAEEQYYYDMYRQAMVEERPELCEELPAEDLIINCPGDDVEQILYSLDGCRSFFGD